LWNGLIDHATLSDTALDPDPNHVVSYFARTIMRDLRMVGSFDVLFGKLKRFLQDDLFEEPTRLDAYSRTMRHSEWAVTKSRSRNNCVSGFWSLSRGASSPRHRDLELTRQPK
jgi:hypothetical protein